MKMYITGIGTIGIFGLGKEALIKAVNEDISANEYESLDINLKILSDKSLFKNLRRSDRFAKLAVTAVDNALKDNLNKDIILENTGLIITTAFGPHNTTFSFLDELIEYGEKNVSPIKFSNSVHSAAGSYIAQLFGIRGPALTISNFKNPVEEAFRLAFCWLETELCQNVILCSVDERGEIYNKAFEILINKGNSLYPTEGSCCFILQKELPDDYYTKFSFSSSNGKMADFVLTTNLNGEKFTDIKNCLIQDFSFIYGDLVTGIAFDYIIASLILNDRIKLNSEQKYTEIECRKILCGKETSSAFLSV